MKHVYSNQTGREFDQKWYEKRVFEPKWVRVLPKVVRKASIRTEMGASSTKSGTKHAHSNQNDRHFHQKWYESRVFEPNRDTRAEMVGITLFMRIAKFLYDN
jgi:hypothetical protein